MRGVRCRDGRVVIVELPEPSGEGVRVRVRSSGICGSDLHMMGNPAFPNMATLGHEFAGVTDDGTAVAVEPILPCGECGFCQSGNYQRCVRGPGMVMGTALEGGIAVAVHGFVQIGLRGDQSVAIVGGGSIGLAAVAVARASGARVELVARHASQMEACERLGARALAEADAASTDSSYVVVVDAAGSSSSIARCIQLAKPGGTLLLLATYWDGMEVPGFLLCLKEVRVVPSMMYGRHSVGRDVDIAAAVLAANPAIASTLITHRFPLDGAPEAFETAAARSSGAIKVVLEP